jgi:signal peptidase II
MKTRVVALGIIAAVIALDHATKFWIQSTMSPYDVWVIIPGFLNIVHSENPGMAFGLFADHDSPWRSFLLVGVSLGILIFLGRLLWLAKPGPRNGRLQPYALALVMGGAAGNLYDRIVRGSVTDFIDAYAGSYHWPTFNVADSAITIGAIMLALDLWLTREEKSEPASAAREAR